LASGVDTHALSERRVVHRIPATILNRSNLI
jgi:hypothetical protein